MDSNIQIAGEDQYRKAVRVARELKEQGIGARTAHGNLIGKYVALYNNVGAVMKNAAKPITAHELLHHPAITQVCPTKQKIQDVMIWYVDRGYVTKRRRQSTPEDRSFFVYEWKGDRMNPDHSVLKVRRSRKVRKMVKPKRSYTPRQAFAPRETVMPVARIPQASKPLPQANGSISAADYIHQHNLEYLEGMVVVCLTNWREKGMPMLLDAQAYLNKLVELEIEKK